MFPGPNHLSSSFYNHSLPGTRFTQSYSTLPSKYTEGVALCMRRCVDIQRLSRKCVQKKKYAQPGTRLTFTLHIQFGSKDEESIGVEDGIMTMIDELRTCENGQKHSTMIPPYILHITKKPDQLKAETLHLSSSYSFSRLVG